MNEAQHDELIQRLDLLIGTLQLAYSDVIAAAREDLLQTPGVAAIIDRAVDWTAPGDLKRVAMDAGSISKATAERRISELVARGVLRQAGAGPATKYRTTGLV